MPRAVRTQDADLKIRVNTTILKAMGWRYEVGDRYEPGGWVDPTRNEAPWPTEDALQICNDRLVAEMVG